MLEQMADKALVLKVTRAVGGFTKELHALLPTAVGLMETSFATGERSPRTERLLLLLPRPSPAHRSDPQNHGSQPLLQHGSWRRVHCV